MSRAGQGIALAHPATRSGKSICAPLLDKLAVAIDQQFVEFTARFISDPWDLRNRYIHVLLGQITADELIAEAAGRQPGDDARLKIHLLLEAQHARQRMYTSCGWFFDDFDRIEPQNNLASAAQAVRLVPPRQRASTWKALPYRISAR